MLKSGKYIAIGRYTDGVNVLGYILRELESGKIIMFNRKDTEGLALKKEIINIAAQYYSGKVLMKGIDCKLSGLPNYDKHCNLIEKQSKKVDTRDLVLIKGKVINGKSISGYLVSIVCNGITVDSKLISREETIKLARSGYISNARVQMSNGKAVLRGVNCELSQLPVMNKNTQTALI